MLLENKVAIVTGAARGIGKAIALALAGEGADIVIVDVLPDAGKEVADQVSEMGRQVIIIPADVSNSSSVKQVVATAEEKFKHIDILINNAGIAVQAPVLEVKEEDLRRVFEVDVFGVFFFTQAVAPYMIEQGGGKVVNISSISAEGGTTTLVPYCAAKGAVNMLTRGLALSLAPYNICVNAIAPGVIETPGVHDMFANPQNKDTVLARTPRLKILQPSDLGGTAVLLASDLANEITGQIIVVDGGYMLQGPEWDLTGL